jgi:Ca2+/H+ antiporter
VANQASSSLLFLSCIGIIIPTTAGYLEIGARGGKESVLAISRGAAIVLLLL